MDSLYEVTLRFSSTSFLITSDSPDLIGDLKAVFNTDVIHDAPCRVNHSTTISVTSEADGAYSVSIGGLLISSGSIEEAAYATMRIMSDSFVGSVSGRLFVMHAAAAAFHDSAILFAGSSGVGGNLKMNISA